LLAALEYQFDPPRQDMVQTASATLRLRGADPDRVSAAFTAMIEGVRKRALDYKLQSGPDFDRGIAALRRAAGDDGVFCYTFFKATGRR
jgi:hypothetical protein